MKKIDAVYKYIVLLACLTAIISPFTFSWVITPSYTKLFIENAEKESELVASHLVSMIFPGNLLLPPEQFNATAQHLSQEFNLYKLKVFTSTGKIIYSTDPKEIGTINNKPYFLKILRRGEKLSRYVRKDTQTPEGKTAYRDVISTYIPIIHQDHFHGAFEIYYDITRRKAAVDQTMRQSTLVVFVLALLALLIIIPFTIWAQAILKKRADDEIKFQQENDKLETLVKERTADLEQTNLELRNEIKRRSEVEAALTASENEYRFLVENQTDLVVKFDRNYKLQFVNSSYCETFDKSQEDLLSGSFVPLIHEDDREKIIRSLQSTLTPPHTTYHEERVLTSKGWRWFGWAAKALLNTNGEVESIEAVGRDITQQKELEEKLRRAKEFSDQLIQTANIMVVILDENGKIKEFNEAAEDISGYSKEELVGGDWIKILVPWERSPEIRTVMEDARGEQIYPRHIEYPIITKSGEERLISWQNSCIYENGKLAAAIFFGTDITEKRIAENALHESHGRLITVLDGLNAMVDVADMETFDLIYANRYFREHFGEIKGKKCWQVLQKNQTGPCHFCKKSKVLDVENNPTGEYTWELQNTVNGTWYEIHDRAITWIDGRLVRLQIATDISMRKSAEEEREKLIAELQQALSEIKVLRGILPICAACKKVRDDKGYWKQIETYIRDHTDAEFSHGICPTCAKRLYNDIYEEEEDS